MSCAGTRDGSGKFQSSRETSMARTKGARSTVSREEDRDLTREDGSRGALGTM